MDFAAKFGTNVPRNVHMHCGLPSRYVMDDISWFVGDNCEVVQFDYVVYEVLFGGQFDSVYMAHEGIIWQYVTDGSNWQCPGYNRDYLIYLWWILFTCTAVAGMRVLEVVHTIGYCKFINVRED